MATKIELEYEQIMKIEGFRPTLLEIRSQCEKLTVQLQLDILNAIQTHSTSSYIQEAYGRMLARLCRVKSYASFLTELEGSIPQLSISFDRLPDILKYIFPDKSLDEIVFGEKIPMNLFPIENTIITHYRMLSKQSKNLLINHLEEILHGLKVKKSKDTPLDRLNKVRLYRNQSYSFSTELLKKLTQTAPGEERRNCASLCSFQFKIVDREMNIENIMYHAVCCGISMDYIFCPNYIESDLRYTQNGQSQPITEDERILLNKVLPLTEDSKMDFLHDMIFL